jgi:Spy/CpxP family protein refolding chaperone
MNRNRILVLTVALVAILAMTAAARGPRGPHRGEAHRIHEHGAGLGLRGLQMLDLSDEQQQAVDEILEQARRDGVELRKQQARLRNQIQGEMLADEPSQADLVELTEQLGELRTELQVLRLKARLAVRARLTAEQRDQLLLMGDGRGGGRLHPAPAPRAPEQRWQRHRQRMLDADDADDDDDQI